MKPVYATLVAASRHIVHAVDHIQHALIELEGTDAASVDDFHRQRLGGLNRPGYQVIQLLRSDSFSHFT